jgi:hypothetical protein
MQKRPYTGETKQKAVVVETAPEVTINKVNVQSLIDSHLYYTGRESGRLYEWRKAGAIVEVDESDVPELLGKRYGKKACCGGERPKIFQLA